jgi:hypothetical protein
MEKSHTFFPNALGRCNPSAACPGYLTRHIFQGKVRGKYTPVDLDKELALSQTRPGCSVDYKTSCPYRKSNTDSSVILAIPTDEQFMGYTVVVITLNFLNSSLLTCALLVYLECNFATSDTEVLS